MQRPNHSLGLPSESPKPTRRRSSPVQNNSSAPLVRPRYSITERPSALLALRDTIPSYNTNNPQAHTGNRTINPLERRTASLEPEALTTRRGSLPINPLQGSTTDKPVKSPKWYRNLKFHRPKILRRRPSKSASSDMLDMSMEAVIERSHEDNSFQARLDSILFINSEIFTESAKSATPARWEFPSNRIYIEDHLGACQNLSRAKIEDMVNKGSLVEDQHGIRYPDTLEYILVNLGKGKANADPDNGMLKHAILEDHFLWTLRKVNIDGETEWDDVQTGGPIVDTEREIQEGMFFGEGSRRKNVRFNWRMETIDGEGDVVEECVSDNEGKSKTWTARRAEKRAEKKAEERKEREDREAERKAREKELESRLRNACLDEDGVEDFWKGIEE